MDAIKKPQNTVQHMQERRELQKGKRIEVFPAIIIFIDTINIK